jgi:hypothetical protein
MSSDLPMAQQKTLAIMPTYMASLSIPCSASPRLSVIIAQEKGAQYKEHLSE